MGGQPIGASAGWFQIKPGVKYLTGCPPFVAKFHGPVVETAGRWIGCAADGVDGEGRAALVTESHRAR